MRTDIERFVKGMIVTIQMWIAPISYSNRSAAIIAEAIVDSKPLNLFSFEVSITCACINKLYCIPCLLFVLKIVRVINFCGFHYPRKFFLTTNYFQTTVTTKIYLNLKRNRD